MGSSREENPCGQIRVKFGEMQLRGVGALSEQREVEVQIWGWRCKITPEGGGPPNIRGALVWEDHVLLGGKGVLEGLRGLAL